MKKFKTLKTLLLVVLTLCLLVGCGNNTVSEQDGDSQETISHINVAPYRWVDGMDPGKDWNGYNSTRFSICEPLLALDESLAYKPMLAESWEQIDEVTYRFDIRDGVTFTNGNPVDAEAIKGSLERVMEINARGGDAKIDTMTVDGEDLIITTTEPFSAFLNNLTEPMYCIVDVTDLDNVDTAPVGTGAYKVVNHVSEERFDLEANEDYWGGAPSIKSISVKNIGHDVKADAILAGDLDVAQGPTATTISRMENNSEGAEILSVMGVREYDMIMNCRDGHLLSDVTLRQAISYSINRDIIAQIIGNGYAQPLTTPFPKTANYGYDRVKGQEYNLEKAKALLEEGGYIDVDGDGYVEDKDGNSMEFVLEANVNVFGTAMAEGIQYMLKEIGIKMEILSLENSSYNPDDFVDVDLSLDGAFPVAVGDGQKWMIAGYTTGGTDNYGGYSSAEYDAVMEKLNKTFDQDERLDLFVEAQQILIDDAANAWLYAPDDVTLISKRMKNIKVFPLNYYLVTTDWALAE